MPILHAQDLSVAYGNFKILDQATVTIEEGERVGLVGRNGTGKSTLLKILANIQSPDSGEVTRQRGIVTGFLPQEFTLDDEASVVDNIRRGSARTLELIEEYEQTEHSAQRTHELEQEISALDGWNFDVRINTLMDALNVVAPDRKTGSLSGGEKRRVALCRALVAQPNFLILDEPTNHLDTETIEWLEEYIHKYRGTLMLVTHDRYFLDRVTTRIIELSHGNFYFYQGNYSRFLEQKAQRHGEEIANERKRQSFIRRELDWVRRGPKARGTKSKDRLDRFYTAVNKKGPESEGYVELLIPAPPNLGNKVAVFDRVGLSYDDNPLFSNLSFEMAAGDRIGLIGKNGIGKTSLLNILLGRQEPNEGTVAVGESVKFNYIDQTRESLNDELTVFEEIGEGNDYVMFDDRKISAWTFLRRFLFEDDRINIKVGQLSGGERNRLLLAKILKRGGNFLILDEPSNDLDLATLRILEEALATFPGCVMVVSHDRYFLNRVCTHVLAFEGNGELVMHEGNYDYYMEKRREQYLANEESAKAKLAAEKPKAAAPNARKLKYKEQQELDAMEERILEAETEVEELVTMFSKPDFFDTHGERVQELTADLEQKKTVVSQLYTRWEELESIQNGDV
ncbi:ABC transporter [bacterium M21]|nr:ABC transporter [bacterium M21]